MWEQKAVLEDWVRAEQTNLPVKPLGELDSMKERVRQLTPFEVVADELISLQAKKNADYGNSFKKTYEKYGIVTILARLNDKLNRLDEIYDKPQLVKDETMRDTLMDWAAPTGDADLGGRPGSTEIDWVSIRNL